MEILIKTKEEKEKQKRNQRTRCTAGEIDPIIIKPFPTADLGKNFGDFISFISFAYRNP